MISTKTPHQSFQPKSLGHALSHFADMFDDYFCYKSKYRFLKSPKFNILALHISTKRVDNRKGSFRIPYELKSLQYTRGFTIL